MKRQTESKLSTQMLNSLRTKRRGKRSSRQLELALNNFEFGRVMLSEGKSYNLKLSEKKTFHILHCKVYIKTLHLLSWTDRNMETDRK